jgi:hypothetical protein
MVLKTRTKCHQYITNSYQEYFKSFKNMANFSITVQKEFIIKENNVPDVPSIALKMINDVNAKFIKIFSMQN